MDDAGLRALVEAWDARSRARRGFDAMMGEAPDEVRGGATAYWETAARLLASEAELAERMEGLRGALETDGPR